MTIPRFAEAAMVVSLFIAYLGLWRIKRKRDIRRSGNDPEVLAQASTPVQAYFARLVRVISGLVVTIIVLHTFAPETWPPLARLGVLDSALFDVLGVVVGVTGLALCGLAQAMMGPSWRVGIDREHRTELVTRGLYRWIRNPTYLGLHLVNLGIWSIWPTTLVAGYILLFFVVMDIQVRCEEEFLLGLHGDEYKSYLARTRRYLPWPPR
jgi:protein-S-isoprenylcysteine O-methyltransferase Ste14